MDLLAEPLAAGARRVARRGVRLGRRGAVADHLVVVVEALEADRHLRERHRRHAVHGHLPRQPPALAPLRVFDRDVTDLGADRLEEAGHVVVAVRIRRHIERPGGPEQQPHDAEPFSLDPQRSRHQPEVGAARHDPELVDTQRPAVGERDVGGVAGGEAVVGLAPGREGMARRARIPAGVAHLIIRGIEGQVGGVGCKVLRDLLAAHGHGDGLARAEHTDLADRVAAPGDVHRQLAAIHHAVPPQRAQAHGDPLAHRRLVRADGAVHEQAPRPRPRDEALGAGIQVRVGRIVRGLQDERGGGGEEQEHRGSYAPGVLNVPPRAR